jgi:ATPase subunit of ABC transporter with duplicated ATPase domains
LDAWDLDSQLEQAMDALRCPPGDTPVTNLSGGERRRVALCKLLLEKPDLLLLDEPTNHLDLEGILWLEKFLTREAPTYLLVSHDRHFLQNMASRNIEIDKLYPNGLFAIDGTYSNFLEKKDYLQIRLFDLSWC